MQRLSIAIAAASMLIASAANAEPYQARIVYGDLDLSSTDGADTLLERINAAAREVCEASPARVSLQEFSASRACVRDFMERALGQLDHPKVGARFAERTGSHVVLASAR